MPSDWLEGLDLTDPMAIGEVLDLQAEMESLEMTGGLEAYTEPFITDVEDEQDDDDEDDENEEEVTDA